MISTFTPIFFIEISFVLPATPQEPDSVAASSVAEGETVEPEPSPRAVEDAERAAEDAEAAAVAEAPSGWGGG